MPLYRYEALGTNGQRVTGNLEAADERAAAATLKDRSLFITNLGPGAAAAVRRRRRAGKVGSQDLAFFFRELALMTRAGVTLLQALQVCERQSGNEALAEVATRLSEQIRAGRSLSQAMAGQDRCFGRLTVRLVASAEATGEMDPVLDRIADIIERRANLRRSLFTSLAYPAIVFGVSVAVAVLLVVGVVPKFAAFFATRNIDMPWTTRTLLDASVWVRSYGLYGLALLLVAGGAVAYAYFTAKGRVALDRAALSLPVVGKLLQIASFAQISWTLGALLRSGVSLLESLRITASVVGNRFLGGHLDGVTRDILGGDTLSRGLEHDLVPPVVPNLIAAGERSGAMTDVLKELSDFYQRDLELRIRRMAGLVEPALILIVGGMVGFVYLAFFQALLQLAQG
ncbi:MAG: type II secretion system F family protein [Planctomycetota bacterium]|jgi:type IV pilus assembly protein PilC